jgi:hypothetical protein
MSSGPEIPALWNPQFYHRGHKNPATGMEE